MLPHPIPSHPVSLYYPTRKDDDYSHMNYASARNSYEYSPPRYISNSPSPTEQSYPQDQFHQDQDFRPNIPHNHSYHGPMDHRRMSEPALFGSYPISTRLHQASFPYNPPANRYPIHRGLSSGSLRDLHEQIDYPTWKREDEQLSTFDEPISPLHPNFSGTPSSPLGQNLHYPPLSDDHYGPSPPGTGTSTSSLPNVNRNAANAVGASTSTSAQSTNSKTYSFVALPGNAVKKRPRRRYDEIERLYQCSWPDCTKSYGTLNHLNAHVTMQKHGQKRNPNEFKELRKQWRKAKKDEAENSRIPSVQLDDRRTNIRRDSEPNLQSYAQQHFHRVPISMPMSISTGDAYGPLMDVRFPPPEEEDEDDGYSNIRQHNTSQSRYAGTPASWHQGMSLPSRASTVHYMSTTPLDHTPSTVPTPSLSTPSPVSGIHGQSVAMNRLPPDSTLLTPLPGYEPAMQFGFYGDGSDERPGTGHSTYTDVRPGTGQTGHSEGDY